MKNLLITILFIISFASAFKSQTTWVPDPSFGNNGITRINFGTAHSDYPNDMLLLPNNKILIGGITTSSTEGYFISMTQLNENGQIDTLNFGIEGKVLVHFVGRDHANVLELQNDGKILAAGSEASSNASSAVTPSLYRFNPDGTIDTTFGNNGRAVNRFTGNSSGELYGIKILQDGKILVAGVSTGTKGFGAMRFLPNGLLDPDFGSGGIARINYSLGYHSVASLFLGDTAIVMATVDISPTNIVLAMMDSLGNPYPSFGSDVCYDMKLDYSGKILLVGKGGGESGLIRLNSDGTVDSTFAPGGKLSIDLSLGNGSNYLRSFYPLQSGDILAAGFDYTSNSGDYVIVKLTQNPTGVEDQGFNQPDDFVLYQNYPNPFNPTTTIEFSIPQSGDVSLNIYNLLGEEVKTLVNEFRQTGKYSVQFNANNFSSGIYFYKLQTDSFVETKKMILLR